MYMSGEKTSVLWIRESNPKYTHRIDMNIGHFVAWSLSDWATDWTSEENHISTSCCFNIMFSLAKSLPVLKTVWLTIQCLSEIKELKQT